MNRFFSYLILQIFVVLGVVLIFRNISDRSFAASFAGFLFLFSTIFILGFEIRRSDRRMLLLVLNGIFLLIFCVPIYWTHWTHLGQSIDDLSIMGVPGKLLHAWSSPMMVLCMIAAAVEGIRKKFVAAAK